MIGALAIDQTPFAPPEVIGHGATVALLPGGRLHLQQGPINLVIRAEGPVPNVDRAYRAATACFQNVLTDLVQELTILRSPVGSVSPEVSGAVAARMVAATEPYYPEYITPMAAVAGAVADEVMAALWSAEGLQKAFVNNGGDIAVRIAKGQTLDIGIVPSLARAMAEASFTLRDGDGVGGVATSGWQGNSLSLGIADAVTVLADNAAQADAAATMIANRVTVEDSAINRVPAVEIDPDSDLGGKLVTAEVGPLSDAAVAVALEDGISYAETLRDRGVIKCALIALKTEWRGVGNFLDDARREDRSK